MNLGIMNSNQPESIDYTQFFKEKLCPCICGGSIRKVPYLTQRYNEPKFILKCSTKNCTKMIKYDFDLVHALKILCFECETCFQRGDGVLVGRCCIEYYEEGTGLIKTKYMCILHDEDFKQFEAKSYYNASRLKAVELYNHRLGKEASTSSRFLSDLPISGSLKRSRGESTENDYPISTPLQLSYQHPSVSPSPESGTLAQELAPGEPEEVSPAVPEEELFKRLKVIERLLKGPVLEKQAKYLSEGVSSYQSSFMNFSSHSMYHENFIKSIEENFEEIKKQFSMIWNDMNLALEVMNTLKTKKNYRDPNL